MDTYGSALSDLGDVGLGLGCFGGCGSLLGGSGLGCSLGSGLLGGSLLSRSLLCSSLVYISTRALGSTADLTHGLLGLGSSSLWCSLGGLGLGLLGLCLLGGRRRAGLVLCELHGSRSTCCQSESGRTSIVFPSRERMDEGEMLTLGALENTRLATLGKSTVELVGENGVGHAGEVVVGLNVFLEGLTTGGRNGSAKNKDATRKDWHATNLLPVRSLSYCSETTRQ